MNIKTEDYILYTSDPQNFEFRERIRAKNFFTNGRKQALKVLFKSDWTGFMAEFTREKVLKALDEQGRFALTYRAVKRGEPIYIEIKAMKMSRDAEHIIVGVSNVNEQMKQQVELEKVKREQIISSRICALVNYYLCIYTVNLDNDTYFESGVLKENSSEFGFRKDGVDFFKRCVSEAKRIVTEEDYPEFVKVFRKDIILSTIEKEGIFQITYRINYKGKTISASLKAAVVSESDGDKLIVGLYREE